MNIGFIPNTDGKAPDLAKFIANFSFSLLYLMVGGEEVLQCSGDHHYLSTRIVISWLLSTYCNHAVQVLMRLNVQSRPSWNSYGESSALDSGAHHKRHIKNKLST